MRMMFKGHDEHGYVYVSGKDSLVCGISNTIGTRVGEIRAVDEGTQARRSGIGDDASATEEIQASGAHGSRKQ